MDLGGLILLMVQKSWLSSVEVGRLSPLFTVGLDAPSQTVVGAHNSEVEG